MTLKDKLLNQNTLAGAFLLALNAYPGYEAATSIYEMNRDEKAIAAEAVEKVGLDLDQLISNNMLLHGGLTFLGVGLVITGLRRKKEKDDTGPDLS